MVKSYTTVLDSMNGLSDREINDILLKQVGWCVVKNYNVEITIRSPRIYRLARRLRLLFLGFLCSFSSAI